MENNDPYTREEHTRLTMRLDTELLDKIKIAAIKHKRTTSEEIESVLEKYYRLDLEKKKNP